MRMTLINRLNKEGKINDAGGIAGRWWALMVALVFGNRKIYCKRACVRHCAKWLPDRSLSILQMRDWAFLERGSRGLNSELLPFFSSYPYDGVLLFSSCHKPSQMELLQQQTFIFSQFWRLPVQDQGVGRFGFSWGLFPCLADGHFLACPHSAFPVWSCITAVSCMS